MQYYKSWIIRHINGYDETKMLTDPTGISELYVGDLTLQDEGGPALVSVPVCMADDIHGLSQTGAIEESNFRVIKGNYSDGLGKWLFIVLDSYGTKSLSYIPDRAPEEFLKMVKSIKEDYPLLDEELYSKVQDEFLTKYIEDCLYDFTEDLDSEIGSALSTKEQIQAVKQAAYQVGWEEINGEIIMNVDKVAHVACAKMTRKIEEEESAM